MSDARTDLDDFADVLGRKILLPGVDEPSLTLFAITLVLHLYPLVGLVGEDLWGHLKSIGGTVRAWKAWWGRHPWRRQRRSHGRR